MELPTTGHFRIKLEGPTYCSCDWSRSREMVHAHFYMRPRRLKDSRNLIGGEIYMVFVLHVTKWIMFRDRPDIALGP